MTKHRVAYLHDPEVGQYYYGPSHPMKPHRMQLAHQLILGYELQNKMMMYKPHKASDKVGPHLHFLFASVQAARPFSSSLGLSSADQHTRFPHSGRMLHLSLPFARFICPRVQTRGLKLFQRTPRFCIADHPSQLTLHTTTRGFVVGFREHQIRSTMQRWKKCERLVRVRSGVWRKSLVVLS